MYIPVQEEKIVKETTFRLDKNFNLPFPAFQTSLIETMFTEVHVEWRKN